MAKAGAKSKGRRPAGPAGDVVTFEEAVGFLKTSKPTLYRWIAEGKVKAFKAGRQWRFYRQDLVKFLEYEEPTLAGIDLGAVREAIEVLDKRIARTKQGEKKGGKR
jgi:excisionase family DNA binding protein